MSMLIVMIHRRFVIYEIIYFHLFFLFAFCTDVYLRNSLSIVMRTKFCINELKKKQPICDLDLSLFSCLSIDMSFFYQ